MSTKSNSVIGNLTVTQNITTGGGVNAKGDSVFAKGVRVEGWLDAPNIRGAYKGLFKYDTSLKSRYPNPQLGWWALVGDNFPAKIYMVSNDTGELEWIDTGNEYSGTSFDGEEINESIEELNGKIEEETYAREAAYGELQTLIEKEKKALQQGIKVNQDYLQEEAKFRIDGDNALQDKINEMGKVAPIYLEVGNLTGNEGERIVGGKGVTSFISSIFNGRYGYIKGQVANAPVTIPVNNLHYNGNTMSFSYIIGVTLYEIIQSADSLIINNKISLAGPGPIQSAPAPIVVVTPPKGDADTKTIKTTILKFRNRIISYDTENIKMITPNGVVFLGYGGGTYNVEGDTIVINWDFEAVEGEYELRVPRGAFIVTDEEIPSINIKYNVSLAPIVYFTPEISPVSGNVSAEDMKSVVVTLPDKFGLFDSNADPWYNDIYLSYMASGGYKEEKSAKFYADITVAEDGRSITIDWSKFSFESGVTYSMNIPKGYIVLDNGDKSDATSIEYIIK